ncbi:MAG: lipoprotein [Bacteroidales bacterium]|jgi:O-glycosyl hydrolase|nr:lipoprotein [Bacteroidales bacterium]
MKRIRILFFVALAVVAACSSPRNAGNPEAGRSGYMTQELQVIGGWGSSLCWWAAQVGKWDEAAVNCLLTAITSPDALNMHIFRYNIGGGDNPLHIDGHMLDGKGKRAEMDGFKASENASYNWTADAGQRRIMLKIKELRPDAVFEAFSNSPPYWMTWSGCAAGNADPAKDNLKPEYYDAFCDYLVDVCKYYKDTFGIEFKTLEPFNEATSSYWYANGSQEGCHFEPQTQMEIIRRLHPKLRAAGLKTVIAASDETNLASFLNVCNAYIEAGDIMDKIGQLNVHTYSGTDDERSVVRNLVQKLGKPFWQSETGPQGRANSPFHSNLLLAAKQFADLRIMQAPVWLDWQLVEENNDTWCLFRGKFATGDYHINKNFYVRMQITRFFKAGYALLETGNPNLLAARSPDKKSLVIAALNTGGDATIFDIDMRSYKSFTANKAFRTSQTENCQEITPPTIAGASMSVESPALSLTTIIMNIKQR